MSKVKNTTLQRIIIVMSFLIVILLIISITSITKMKNSSEIQSTENGNLETDKVSNRENNYDCSFTKTYRIVNNLDGYIAEVSELSYVVIDMFQNHYATTHIIPTRLKENLKVGKYYEFTYTIKGTGNLQNMSDLYNAIADTEIYHNASDETKNDISKDKKLFVDLTIKATDKQGLEQIQENPCW